MGLGEALHNAAIQNAIHETYAPVVVAVTTLLDAYVATAASAPASTRPTSCCSWATSGGSCLVRMASRRAAAPPGSCWTASVPDAPAASAPETRPCEPGPALV